MADFEESYPSFLYRPINPAIASAVPGTPGQFKNAYGQVVSSMPADLAALNLLGALGNMDPWTEGQYVVLGDGSEAYWSGTAWTAGRAPADPATRDTTVVKPGDTTPLSVADDSVVASPLLPWDHEAGEYATFADGDYWWDAGVWVVYVPTPDEGWSHADLDAWAAAHNPPIVFPSDVTTKAQKVAYINANDAYDGE